MNRHRARTRPRASTIAAVMVVALAASASRAVGAEPTAPTTAPTTDSPSTAQIEFNRDIRPILAAHCYACHGPDARSRQAELRLDDRESAVADRDASHAIVPGSAATSEVYRRLTTADAAERMPPPESKAPLSAAQIELVRRWIDEGAVWQPHWSLLAPRRPEPPPGQPSDWVRNPIDALVFTRFQSAGRQPAVEADRPTLIRRVTLDLTGSPPTPAEVDAFLADASPDAYERVVDRLLSSPRYGEQMALAWLEAARFADTSGYQNDGPRQMWRWRDWVIEAFNSNMPFDRFTIEQLAGDLLPGATLEQRLATGFNRNHRGNAEGGIIPEEYAVEYVVDRVETTATVWLGLTIGCARCHDHKFDPITQREFFELFAFFNNIPEHGRAIKVGNSPPMVAAPTREQSQSLVDLDRAVAAADARLATFEPAIAAAQQAWERSLSEQGDYDWNLTRALVAHFPLDDTAENSSNAAAQTNWIGDPATYQAGQLGQAARFNAAAQLDAGDLADFGYLDKFSLAAWVRVNESGGGTIISRMADMPQGEGFSVALEGGAVHVRLVKRWLDDSIRVETREALEPGNWHHVLVTYDGSRLASGVRVYLDGQSAEMTVLLDELNQTFSTKAPLRIGAGGGPDGQFTGLIDEVRVYANVLEPTEAAVVAMPASISDLALRSADRRSAAETAKLRLCFLESHAPAAIQESWSTLVDLRRQRQQLIESFPTAMVMEEMPTPRPTHVLQRGQYDRPGEQVTADVPSCLPPLPADAPRTRLALARWLVDPSNPLVARVAVNRFWQSYFGVGLVKTSEDFGCQGEPPSHPELLDWLATEFVRLGWDIKALQRLIVTSATYRQSSQGTAADWQHDPDNRWLARGPRVRLAAETIRDQALAASGLLVEQLGGPSVKPYQPAGLWKELATDTEYAEETGPSLYRRSLYTYRKRTVSSPTMAVFDAPSRETCSVRPPRTNTPLQALTLLNDVTFVEAARVLAERAMREGGSSADERISLMFRLVLARQPSQDELRVLNAALDRHLAQYRRDPQAASELGAVGHAPRAAEFDVTEIAAYTVLASLVLNLDEAITKR